MNRKTLLAVLAALILAVGCIGAAQAEILPPHGMGQIGYQAVVLCEELTMRQEPSASSRALRTLRYGDYGLVIEERDGWAYCTLGDTEDSPKGWLNADYLIINPAWYRTEGKTAVYAWDDTSAPKLALLSANTTLPILKQEGDWLLVSLRGAAGWICQ